MDDPISRSMALSELKAAYALYPVSFGSGFDVARRIIAALPTVDTDIIVRCQDCDYAIEGDMLRCNLFNVENVPVRAFCAWGKEKKK